ncbi:hypothetical protein TrST_g7009 [Triparma strigata]|uniref:ApaG domain-containing protein n=1 Tax=Triparma strigata TaxID=1606541 RepID=A0A9W7F549_9STRA|nr:hypothetical protein TrST_g7009 [Triparma strigata]|mmetsp:Transcript_22331/g.41969  ORF Transcript_22331/g.41969 Transcript_22331/m.41969 type:complete len:254 (-) Transcript_22331:53-814(-)
MAVARAVYRLLNRRLSPPNKVTILPPLDHISSPNWGSYRTLNLSIDAHRQTQYLSSLHPPLPYPATRSSLLSFLRTSFRSNSDRPSDDLCLDALLLSDSLLNVSNSTSTSTSNGLTIQLTSKYLHDSLETEKSVYQYRVRVVNSSPTPIRLLGRSWLISSDLETIKVNQPTSGVVGQFPVLSPQGIFEYSSGCEISGSGCALSGKLYYEVMEEGDKGDDEVDYKNAKVEEIEVGAVELKAEGFIDIEALGREI